MGRSQLEVRCTSLQIQAACNAVRLFKPNAAGRGLAGSIDDLSDAFNERSETEGLLPLPH